MKRQVRKKGRVFRMADCIGMLLVKGTRVNSYYGSIVEICRSSRTVEAESSPPKTKTGTSLHPRLLVDVWTSRVIEVLKFIRFIQIRLFTTTLPLINSYESRKQQIKVWYSIGILQD